MKKLYLIVMLFLVHLCVNKMYSQDCSVANMVSGGLTSCGPVTTTLTVSSISETDYHRWYTADGQPVSGIVQGTGEEADHISSLTATFTYSTYYNVTIYRAKYNCETPPTRVYVTINPIPSAPTTEYQNFCGGSPTVANLTATVPSGCFVQWFTEATGGTPLSSSTPLVRTATGKWYYAQSVCPQQICVNSSRSGKFVTLNDAVPAPTAPAYQYANYSTWVHDLIVTLPPDIPGHEPYEAHWYDTPTGGYFYYPTDHLYRSGTYYVATYWGETGCESPRVASYINVGGYKSAPIEKQKNTITTNKPSVYPNPIKDKLHIKLADNLKNTNVSLKLYNVQGIKVYESVVTNDADIDFETFTPGVYLLRINNEVISVVK